MKKKTIVIVPAFNEERSIAYVVEKIKTLHPEFKILVIDDGSSDNTAERARVAGAAVISLPLNLGIGGAVQTGFCIAEGEDFDFAVQIDGDAQHDPRYIETLLSPVLRGDLDLCIGSRFLCADSVYKATLARRAGIRFFSGLLKVMTGMPLTDPTSGFRAFNRKMITAFALSYPVDYPEPEIIKTAKRLGAKVGEVPVRMFKRQAGKSSIRYFKTVYYMVKVTLAIFIDSLKPKARKEAT